MGFNEEMYEVRLYLQNEWHDSAMFVSKDNAKEYGELFLDDYSYNEKPSYELWKKVHVAKPTGQYEVTKAD